LPEGTVVSPSKSGATCKRRLLDENSKTKQDTMVRHLVSMITGHHPGNIPSFIETSFYKV
jgi:hypothetical protein